MATNARLNVWVQPKASRTEISGMHGDALKIRLAAVPVDGAANDELVEFLAGKLGVPRSAVSIVAGQSGRRKVVEVDGMDRATLENRLLRSLRVV